MKRHLPRFFAVVCLVSASLVWFAWHSLAEKSESRGEGGGWRVGLAATDITPRDPVYLAGYASRDHAHEGVAAPLHAKALALVDDGGHRAVIITTDLIGLTSEVAEPICTRLSEKTGLDRADILINSSHTHTGPALTLSADPTTKMNAEEAARQVSYTRQLQDAIFDLAIEALDHADHPARLTRATGVAPFVMNRREPTEDRGIVLGVNPRGPVDRSVPALRVTSGDDDRLLAVLFQAACHNTTLGGNFYRITGDYAGYAQQFVEEKHPGTEALFMIGCAGDANPYPRGELSMSETHGRELGEEICRLLDDEKVWKPVNGPLTTCFTRVDLPLQPAPEGKALAELKLGSGGWRGFVASEIEKRRSNGETIPDRYRAPFSVWQFGNDLTLVGLSGEVVVDYVYRIEEELGPADLWIAAYCHDVYGYLPSARVLREGGYETRGLYAGGIGLFAPEAEDVVAKTVRDLAVKAGRELP
ncbi:MAG: neutral/alkaline non-lysosomal ceramidase N-terminal domain-containing protein [Verrucomicrobiae bacterium]|nr:neutral/alkaline non-lysosomal ceramidase N-terminal domain-containing protein [Verrucomicrobiae bacterium]